jgi:hypothetical protein
LTKQGKAVTWAHAVILSDLMRRISGHACRVEPTDNNLYLVYRLNPYNDREYPV